MAFINSISLVRNAVITTQKEQRKINIRMLTIFLGASLFLVGFLTAGQTTRTCQCPQEKHCGVVVIAHVGVTVVVSRILNNF